MSERTDTSISISQAHNIYLDKLAKKMNKPKSSVLSEMIAFCGRHSVWAVETL